MSRVGKSHLLWLWLSVALTALDLASKYLARQWLVPYQPHPVLPFFNLTLAFNRGAAFSLLSDASGWQRWFFVALGLAATVVIIAWLRRLKRGERRTAVALALILGGAMGNLIERLWWGRVTDFIDVYYRGWHWPAFNVADSAITVGIVVLLLDGFLRARVRA